MHAIAFCGPILLSAALVYLVARLVPPPRASLGVYLLWWTALSGGATVALALAGRLSRRLLPVAALMRLSLVFPDGAPSRFAVALRSGTVATLEERLVDARRGAATRTPMDAAQLLLELVALLDTHDRLTRGHSERVRVYAQSIGKELGLDRTELDLLNWAALLHDVGKLDVPAEVLTKAGRPNEREWELIRRHPEAGGELAAPLREWLGEWFRAIEDHHERWDGAGYPHGLSGSEISLAGRIVALADAYDVITSSRSYKDARAAEAARRELASCAGAQFDPDVVRAFLELSIKPRRAVAAPLAWLAHASVLARVPVAPAVGAVSAAAIAVGAGLAPPDVRQREREYVPLARDATEARSELVARRGLALASEETKDRGTPTARAMTPKTVAQRAAAPDAPHMPVGDPEGDAQTPDTQHAESPPPSPGGPSPGTDPATPADPKVDLPSMPRADPPVVDVPVVPLLETVADPVEQVVDDVASVVPLPVPPSLPPLPPAPPALGTNLLGS